MRLEDNIYRINEFTTLSETVAEVSISLLPESDIYRGHFPGNPVTPGVVMIGIGRELLQKLISQSLSLTKVVNTKYTAVLSPARYSCVTYKIEVKGREENSVKAKVIVSDDSVVFATMIMQLEIQ